MANQKRSAGPGVGTRAGKVAGGSAGPSKSGPSGRERGGGGRDEPSVEETTHRGIKWQKAASGRMRWWDDDDDRWVMYKPGKDAPPRPLGWEAEARKQQPAPLTRPKWSSPYRLVPLLIFLGILVYGSWQAFHPSTKGGAQKAAALEGKCLSQAGGSSKSGIAYNDKPVACTAPGAAVKVTFVLGPAAGKGSAAPPGCPAPSSLVVLLAHTATPYYGCVAPLHPAPSPGPNGVGT